MITDTKHPPKPRPVLGDWMAPGVVFVVLLACWQAISVGFAIPHYLLPTPWEVGGSLLRDRAKLGEALWITGREAGGALLASTAAGMIGATGFARFGWLRRWLFPYTLLLQTVPILAIAPLILTWLGNGPRQVTLIAAIISLPPILVNATQGLVSVGQNELDLFATHGASRWQVLRKLRWPHALPSLFAGLRIASGLSVIGAITGELFAGSARIGVGGLGYSLTYANAQTQTDYLFALAAVSSWLGFGFFFAVVSCERLCLGHWHASAMRHPSSEL